ncbi:MAG: restriction endonuclease subunit S, partial [Candidatus Pacebacteria bacterium]|nr:restriction endonuclease subunit S [Candidatus Paceibacterota bacterium]
IRYSLKRGDFLIYVNSQVSGMRMPRLKTESGRNALIPLPPLPEQQAIVERVDKLMTMIDKLEKQVTERKEQSQMLMQSVLKEAFES